MDKKEGKGGTPRGERREEEEEEGESVRNTVLLDVPCRKSTWVLLSLEAEMG